jgi:hypothetical protein
MMICKDCPHFRIDYPPLKGVDFGRASCDKHNLITNFLDKRKFKSLKCVEEEGDSDGHT